LENSVANGGTWNTTTSVPNYHFQFDLSSIAALENQADVYFRLTASTVGTSFAGTNRVDNFTVSGTAAAAVPEASTILIWALLGGVAVITGSRCRPEFSLA
jgi:hypothetical protein